MDQVWIGLSICGVILAMVYLSGRMFQVSDKEYARIIEEHGEMGKQFILQQKKRYGSQFEFNNKLVDKFRHDRVVQYYAEKDRLRNERREKRDAAKYKDE